MHLLLVAPSRLAAAVWRLDTGGTFRLLVEMAAKSRVASPVVWTPGEQKKFSVAETQAETQNFYCIFLATNALSIYLMSLGDTHMVKLLLCLLLLPATVGAAEITFLWEHEGQGKPSGFKLYSGDLPQADRMKSLLDIPDGAARKVTILAEHEDIRCYGLSAYNVMGESAITLEQDNGEDLCLGKPLAPRGFTFLAK